MADIAIRKVVKSYGKEQVVHGVDLDIRSGEFLVILGPSGCGKSTLLRMIAGLEEISDGEIAIDGAVVNQLEPRERGCAMVFQNYALYPHMTVAENIGYALRVAGMKKADRRAKVEQVAKIIGLGDFLDRKPGQLSGGQRQRVAMGRAMIREPKVFLFDEPLSNLDAKLRVQMRLEIRRLHKRLGTTSVFVTHDQIEAMTLADRLVVMNSGVIEQVGTPAEIYGRPASTYVAGFIGSPPMNFLPANVDRARHALLLPFNRSIDLSAAQLRAIPGDLVRVGVRPEALHRASDAARAPILARFAFAEELGNGRLWHMEVEDMELIMLTTESDVPRAGAEVSLTFAPDALHLFDAETGRRIEAPATVTAAREIA